MNASGLFTKALASAIGLSSTMAMSISPPSFLMRAVLPCCILFKIATALFSHMHLSHSSLARCARDPVCGGTVWIAGVPSALRNALSGISELGREATTDATRKKSLSLTSLDRVVFCVMSNSESIHIWCNVKSVFGSLYHLFQTALWAHWGALRLISTRSLFIHVIFTEQIIELL